MGLTIAEKILKKHLQDSDQKFATIEKGKAISIKIDQTLTQDATGTMAYLQFEAMGVARVKTEVSVSYVDHNTLQNDFLNADDHKYLQSVAAKHGVYFSRPGNGICHQVHLERFGAPGKTLLGSDSHTPTGGGLGMIAIGAGGLDVAAAMAGYAFNLNNPKIMKVELTGKLRPFVSAKDVILEVLRQISVKGGIGYILEYAGAGVKTLSVPERATITNMGAETGATTSVFPSDEITLEFLQAEGREDVWQEIVADDDAHYDKVISIDLDKLEPLVAQPHMPDEVVPLSKLKWQKVDQVLIGSCTNSSYKDLMVVAHILKGKKVNSNISFGVAPGSKQVFEMIADNGALADIISSGARILESACGFCIGMGQSPNTNGISVRTNNRNFKGRSGTPSGSIYLVSPEVAAATALKGVFSTVDDLGDIDPFDFEMPAKFTIDDSMLLAPDNDGSTEIIKGPNIKAVPTGEPLAESLAKEVILKVGDNITTDDIMPAGSKILPLRSNIPEISKYVYQGIDEKFHDRALAKQGGFIVGGENYGQGSSREHAALAPMFLGVKAIIVKSFARIHKANLINFGILPLTFNDPTDYDKISQGATLEFPKLKTELSTSNTLTAVLDGNEISVAIDVSEREKDLLLSGGLLSKIRQESQS